MKEKCILTLLLILTSLFGLVNVHGEPKTLDSLSKDRADSSPKTGESRLFEVINSYLDGMRGGSNLGRAKSAINNDEQRRSPDNIVTEVDKSETTRHELSNEEALARRRYHNSDWELASVSLQRALQLLRPFPITIKPIRSGASFVKFRQRQMAPPPKKGLMDRKLSTLLGWIWLPCLPEPLKWGVPPRR